MFTGLGHHDFTGHHEDFLRGHGDILAGAYRGQRRLQPGGADDGDQHNVRRRQSGQLDQPLCAGGHPDAVELRAQFVHFFRRGDRDQLGTKLLRLLCEELGVAARRQANEADVVGQILGNLGGAGANRAGATE